jgi:hypothetical protein
MESVSTRKQRIVLAASEPPGAGRRGNSLRHAMKPHPRGTGCVHCARPDLWGASSGLRPGGPIPEAIPGSCHLMRHTAAVHLLEGTADKVPTHFRPRHAAIRVSSPRIREPSDWLTSTDWKLYRKTGNFTGKPALRRRKPASFFFFS